MLGDYGTGEEARPRVAGCIDCDVTTPPRLYLCGQCRRQVVICSGCDRGNIYCGACAPLARRRSVRAAGARYQQGRRGRHKHAERTRRWRARKNNVTHHGSPDAGPDDVLAQAPAVVAPAQIRPPGHCLFCGRRCPDFVRRDFLRRRGPWINRRGLHHDHSP